MKRSTSLRLRLAGWISIIIFAIVASITESIWTILIFLGAIICFMLDNYGG